MECTRVTAHSARTESRKHCWTGHQADAASDERVDALTNVDRPTQPTGWARRRPKRCAIQTMMSFAGGLAQRMTATSTEPSAPRALPTPGLREGPLGRRGRGHASRDSQIESWVIAHFKSICSYPAGGMR